MCILNLILMTINNIIMIPWISGIHYRLLHCSSAKVEVTSCLSVHRTYLDVLWVVLVAKSNAIVVLVFCIDGC